MGNRSSSENELSRGNSGSEIRRISEFKKEGNARNLHGSAVGVANQGSKSALEWALECPTPVTIHYTPDFRSTLPLKKVDEEDLSLESDASDCDSRDILYSPDSSRSGITMSNNNNLLDSQNSSSSLQNSKNEKKNPSESNFEQASPLTSHKQPRAVMQGLLTMRGEGRLQTEIGVSTGTKDDSFFAEKKSSHSSLKSSGKRNVLANFLTLRKSRSPTVEDFAALEEKIGIERDEILNLYQEFSSLAGRADFITKDGLAKALGFFGMRDSLLSSCLFNAFDKDRTGRINFAEFATGMITLTKGSLNDKLGWAFSIFDIEHTGYITQGTFALVISSMYSILGWKEKSVSIQIQEYIDEIFRLFDKNKDEKIDLDEYKRGAILHPDLLRGLGVIRHQKEKDLITLTELTSHQKKGVTFGRGLNQWNLVLLLMTGLSECNKKIWTPDQEVNSPDFEVKEKYDINGGSFYSYAPHVFSKIRQLSGISNSDFLLSLGIEQILGNFLLGSVSSFAPLSTNSKSGAHFYFSHDQKYLVKSATTDERNLLLKILPDYYDHLKKNPDSLLIRFYGLYEITTRSDSFSFVVMKNLFSAGVTVHETYDLKGSSVGRYGSKDSILKDNDFIEGKKKISLGSKRAAFLETIKKDAKFLESMEIIDYSLLLGIHEKESEEIVVTEDLVDDCLKKESSFRANFRRSMRLISGQIEPLDLSNETEFQAFLEKSRKKQSKQSQSSNYGGMVALDEKDNEIGEIYFMGIIDTLIRYGIRKRAENFAKSVIHDSEQISVVNPQAYSTRFYEFFVNATDISKSSEVTSQAPNDNNNKNQ